MLKITAICGNGMGTSMIIKLKVEEIMKKLNINAIVDAISIGQANQAINTSNIIICSTHLIDSIPNGSAKVVSVKNLMDAQEIEKAIKKAL